MGRETLKLRSRLTTQGLDLQFGKIFLRGSFQLRNGYPYSNFPVDKPLSLVFILVMP
jgi:hypothetical protein